MGWLASLFLCTKIVQDSVQILCTSLHFYFAINNEAIEIISRFESAIELTKKYANGYNNVLKIGYLGPAETTFLPDAIHSFKKEHHGTDILLIQDNLNGLMEALHNKEIDFFLSGNDERQLPPNIIYSPIHKESFVVVLNKNHELITKKTIDLSELTPYSFILPKKKFASKAYEMLFKLFNNQLFEPKTIYEVENIDQVIVMVKTGIGYTILPKKALDFYDNTHLIWKPITNNPLEYTQVALWDRHNENPYIILFLNTLKKFS